jgi:hypothetical protein
VPPMINTGRPDIDKIQNAVQKAIHPKKAKKGTTASTSGDTLRPANQGTTGGAIGSLHTGYAANQASDLGSAC